MARHAFQLRFIDWANPSANVFHACAEFDVEREHTNETRRPDIVLFVNGIPFVVIECKGPAIGVDQAVSQQIRNQQDGEIPGLFRTVQLLVATNKNEVRYGTVGTPAAFWSRWREMEDREPAAAVNTPLDAAKSGRLSSMASARIGSLMRHNSSGNGSSPNRIAPMGARAAGASPRSRSAFHAIRRRREEDRPLSAVFRRAQNSPSRNRRARRRGGEGRCNLANPRLGKSLTMVMFARALGLEASIADPRIVLVTDRIDLDEQLEGTFKACGLEPKRATTGRNLLDLVATEKRAVVTTLINKFDTALNVRDFADPSEDVFLLVDEGHRASTGDSTLACGRYSRSLLSRIHRHADPEGGEEHRRQIRRDYRRLRHRPGREGPGRGATPL